VDKLKEKVGENNEKISNAKIVRGKCSVSLLNRNEKGWEEKFLSGTKRAEKEPV
jgi:hypothetical protein